MALNIRQKLKNFGKMTSEQFGRFKDSFSKEINIDNAPLLGPQQPNKVKSLGILDDEQFNQFKARLVQGNSILQQNILPTGITPKQIPIDEPTEANTVGGINFAQYATAEDAIPTIKTIFKGIPDISSAQDIQKEIDRVRKVINQANPPETEITGEMIFESARRHGIDPRILIAILRKESQLGTNLLTKNNPGNIGNTGKATRTFETMQEGIDAVARELARRIVRR